MRGGLNAKPIERHRAEGTLRSDRHAETPTTVAGRGEMKPARGLDAATRRCFRELAEAGKTIYDLADAPLVEAAAVALARARAATKDIAKRGQLVEVRRVGRDGSELVRMEANPSIAIERNAWAEFRQLADRLGIGPSARARLAGAGVEGATEAEAFDELAELRKARGGPRTVNG